MTEFILTIHLFEYARVDIITSHFTWYGIGIKEGRRISVSNKKELYLVKDYFDGYDEIVAGILPL